MKKRNVVVTIITGILAISLAGCGGTSASSGADSSSSASKESAEASTSSADLSDAKNDSSASAASDSDITVAGIVFQDDQFMNMLTKGYEDAAKENNVTIMTDNTNNDSAKEVELINTYVTQGVDGIAIAPLNGESSVAALRAADESGVKVALTNVDLDNADFIVAGYTSNDYDNCYKAGQEAAEIMKDKLGDKTVKIATIQFASQLPDISKNRIDGYLKGIEDGGVKYEVVANQDAWMQDTALETASSIMTANKDLDAIITVNDGGTIGSVTAVENAGKSDQVLVFGHDGSDQISSMILDENSPLQSVVAQDPYGMGYNAVNTLVKAIRGDDYSDTKGKCEYMEGIILSKRDKNAVNSWRVDNGFEEIK